MRKIVKHFCILAAVLAGVTYLINKTLVKEYTKTFPRVGHLKYAPSLSNPLHSTNRETETCRPRKHLMFLKVHKAGSSTVANVIFRYGLMNNLTFVLPKIGYQVSTHLNRPFINILPFIKNRPFDILTSHSVHNPTEWDRLLYPDSMKVAILREPLSHLTSALHYFKKNRLGNRTMRSTAVARYITMQSRTVTTLRNRSYFANSMAYELGIDTPHLLNLSHITQHTQRLDKTYDLIMIMELMDESLLLLRRLLCWELKDIVYIPVNVNRYGNKTEEISDKLLQKHRDLARADYYLYYFFYDKLFRQISEQGPGFEKELAWYCNRDVLFMSRKFCRERWNRWNEPTQRHLVIPETEWNKRFVVTTRQCFKMEYRGTRILTVVKYYQYGVDDRIVFH